MQHTGSLLIAAALAAALARAACAQAPAGPAPAPADGSTAAADPAPAWVLPAPEHVPYQDRNGPLLEGDPLLDGAPGMTPGWFAAVEVDPVWVHVKNQLAEPVAVGDNTDQVHLPTEGLGVTVMPRLEVGYRFAQGSGEFLASYRFVETAGSESGTLMAPGAVPGSIRSRFDLNVLDLDYGSREFTLAMGPGWDMKWRAGVRLANLYFDSQAAGPGVAQRVTNHYLGAGPHTGLELGRHLGDSGLALFARLDAELLVGTVNQSFTETRGAGSGETDQSQLQAAPVLSVQAGLGWTPPQCCRLRFAAGYTWERWWDVGFVAESKTEVTVQGVFLRGEWRY